MFKESLRRRLEVLFPHRELARWYDPLMLQKDEEERVLRVFFPHPFFRNWFLQNLRRDFEKEAAFLGQDISFCYEESPCGPASFATPKYPSEGKTGEFVLPAPFASRQPAQPENEQSFANFLVNKKNLFPLNAAKKSCSIAAAKGQLPYIPMVFYGKSGSGKSHLLSAICDKMRQNGLPAHFGDITYLERICVSPGRYAQAPESCVCLDDAQRVRACPDLQDALAALIDSFTRAGKLLALAFECHPEHLSVKPTLKSRLTGGLTAELKRPDLDIRLQYVQLVDERRGLELSKEQILALCRRHQDIRCINGALTNYTAMHSLGGAAPAGLLDNMTPSGGAPATPVTAKGIIQTVALHFRVDVDDLTGKNKDRQLSFARHAAIYLCRELLGLSLVQIGRVFGGRDHSSVLYSIKKIKEIQNSDKERNKTVEKLRQLCLGAL